jgi:hypothetical protein
MINHRGTKNFSRKDFKRQLNGQRIKLSTSRNIRNRSLSDLIPDELIRGKGIGGAIHSTFGLKSKARIKGIKEKFDILNIVKTLTNKSRLATALAGKILGRSKKDIEYFTGRATHQ